MMPKLSFRDGRERETAEQLAGIFGDLFSIWGDTENAKQVLEDAARSIAHRMFGLDGYGGIEAFVALCHNGEEE